MNQGRKTDFKARKYTEETDMIPIEKTLHWAVEKWLGPRLAMPARVVRISRTQTGFRCVCVEAMCHGGLLSIFFFRHDDGSWNVYPPAQARPAMSTRSTA